MKKLLSICIPVFNRYYLLSRLLNSIKTKYPEKIECILVNDGSKDNLFELVKSFRKKNKKIKFKYIFQRNMGVAHAMLTAYRNSSCKYCIKMDSDDVFLKKGIDNVIEELEQKSNKLKNKKICGIIFGTLLKKKKIVRNELPENLQLNFLSLRADLKNFYDCKEVVKTNIILNSQFYIPKQNRVVQQIWLLMGKKYDVYTSKKIIAKKEYNADGLSAYSAINYKVKEALILEKINRNLIFSKRYKSSLFRLRCILLRQKYALHSNKRIVHYYFDIFLLPLSLIFYIYEIILFKLVNRKK